MDRVRGRRSRLRVWLSPSAGIDYGDVLDRPGRRLRLDGDSAAGQSVIYEVGLGRGADREREQQLLHRFRTALYLARQAVEAGIVDVALAVGFRGDEAGALGTVFIDLASR